MIISSDDTIQFDDLNKATEAIISKNLTANQKYVQLAISDKILKINRVEVSYDLTTWTKAEPINQGEVSRTINLQADINNNFDVSQPFYEVKGLYVYLYPVPTASQTAGIKFYVQREPDEFTSGEVTTGTKVPGFDATWHPMIALGMAADWFSAKKLWNEYNAVLAELADYEARLRRAYGSKSEDIHMQLKSAYSDSDFR